MVLLQVLFTLLTSVFLVVFCFDDDICTSSYPPTSDEISMLVETSWFAYSILNVDSKEDAMEISIPRYLSHWKVIDFISSPQFFEEAQMTVVYSKKKRSIGLFCSGSNAIIDWFNNIDFFHDEFEYCDGCKVHGGFNDAVLSITPQIFQILRSNLEKFDRILVSGHSLGGACSSITAAHIYTELTEFDGEIDIITSGSPRIGNLEFSNFVNEISNLNIRLVSNNDIVPYLPIKIMDFAHVSKRCFQIHGICDLRSKIKKPSIFEISARDHFEAKYWKSMECIEGDTHLGRKKKVVYEPIFGDDTCDGDCGVIAKELGENKYIFFFPCYVNEDDTCDWVDCYGDNCYAVTT